MTLAGAVAFAAVMIISKLTSGRKVPVPQAEEETDGEPEVPGEVPYDETED